MAVTEGSGARFDFGRVTSRTFGLIGRNFVPFLILSLILSGAPYLIVSVVRPALLQGNPGMMGALTVLVGLVSLLTGLLLQAALTRASIDDLSGKGVSLGAALSTGLAVMLPMLGLGIVIGVAVAVGFLLLIVPGVYLALRWAVAAPVLVVEKAGIFAAMERSAGLTQNHRWGIFGLVVLYVLFAVVVQVVIALIIPGSAEALAGAVEPSILFLVIMTAVQAVTSMIATVGVAAIYFELRQIKEGVGVTELASVFD